MTKTYKTQHSIIRCHSFHHCCTTANCQIQAWRHAKLRNMVHRVLHLYKAVMMSCNYFIFCCDHHEVNDKNIELKALQSNLPWCELAYIWLVCGPLCQIMLSCCQGWAWFRCFTTLISFKKRGLLGYNTNLIRLNVFIYLLCLWFYWASTFTITVFFGVLF